jgi:3-oxoacyl-[acyl-carrier-protein] synthase III
MPPKLDTQPAIDKIKEAVHDMNQETAKLLHQRTRDLSNDIRHLRAENKKQSEEIDKVNRLLEGKRHGRQQVRSVHIPADEWGKVTIKPVGMTSSSGLKIALALCRTAVQILRRISRC